MLLTIPLDANHVDKNRVLLPTNLNAPVLIFLKWFYFSDVHVLPDNSNMEDNMGDD